MPTIDDHKAKCLQVAETLKQFTALQDVQVTEAVCTAHLLRQVTNEDKPETMEVLVKWAVHAHSSVIIMHLLLIGALEAKVINGIPQFGPIDGDRAKMLAVLQEHGVAIPESVRQVAAENAKKADKKVANPQG